MTTNVSNIRQGNRSVRMPVLLPFLVAIVLGCAFLPAAVLANPGTVGWLPAGDASGGRLVTSSGVEVYRTTNPVHGLRTIEPFQTGLQLVLWDEETEPGHRAPHYAILNQERLLGRVRETAYTVDLVGGRFEPLTEGPPVFPASLRANADNRLFFVQMVVTPLPALQQAIRGLGGIVHRHLSHHTMIVEMTPAVGANVAILPYVRWLAPYHPGHRLEPAIRSRLIDGSLGAKQEAQRYSIMLLERGDAVQQSVAASIRAAGGTVNVLTAQGLRMEATLNARQLLALAHDNRVQYIDRWPGPLETDMEIVRAVGGADFLETVAGFTGAGVRAEVLDSELRTSHQEWANAPLIHSNGTAGSPPHGSSVTSNVFAAGTSPLARGLLPDGQPIFFLAGEATPFGGSTSRYTIYEQLRDPAGPYRAVLQTSSVGNARTRLYTTLSAETDDALFLHPVLSTQSQSNAGNQDSRPQAWAKNIVSVGGFRHFSTADRADDRWGSSASIGPAADGRIKPDLAFFYDGIFSASNSTDTSYTSFGGTSSATPQTAGYFGLLFEMWHEGVWTGHGGGGSVFASRPQMMTAKALMIHHAHRYDWTQGGANSDLDRFKQGWGTADARNLYDTAEATQIIDESVVLPPLGSYSTSIPIAGGEPQLKATLAYLEPMGTVGAAIHRVNDLSLRVTSPSGTVYWGNNGLTTSNASTPDGSSNQVDTVENVLIPNPEAGVWTVEVLADEVVADNHPETPAIDVDFALVTSPLSAIFVDGFEAGDTSAWSVTTPAPAP